MLKTIVNYKCRLTMAQEKTAVTFFFIAAQKNIVPSLVCSLKSLYFDWLPQPLKKVIYYKPNRIN